MSSNHFFKAGNFAKFLCLSLTVVLFSYCTTYNNVASSFGKRKYTKGHFFESVPKINTAYNAGSQNTTVKSEANPQNEVSFNKSLITNTTNAVKAIFTAPATTATVKESTHKKAIEEAATIAKSTSPVATENVSKKESSSNDPYVGQNNHVYKHDDSKQGTFLAGWLICLALSLLLVLLFVNWADTANVNNNSTAGTGCIFGLLLLLSLIGTIVFFILWVVSLSS